MPAGLVREMVHKRLDLLQRQTGLPVVFGGAVQSHPEGKPAAVITESRGVRTSALHGLTVLSGTGLGGRAMGLGRVCVVEDYARSRMISHEYDRVVQREGLVSLLAAPIHHDGGVVAVLYAASRALPVGGRAMRGAETVARHIEHDLQQALPSAVTPERSSPEVLAELRAVADALDGNPLRARVERVLAALGGGPALPREQAGPNPLTVRQIQILRLIEDGLTNREIARATGLADATVKTYVHEAMRRLEAHTRTRAVYLARRRGLL